jgi:hypothetical protein
MQHFTGGKTFCRPNSSMMNSDIAAGFNQLLAFCTKLGNSAILTAIRRASFLVSNLAADLRPGSSSK